MAYYTALQNAWTSAIQPPAGVLGTGLTGTMTTQQKIDAVNGWIITGTIPSSFFVTGAQLSNCIIWPEFNAITTASLQSNIMALCTIQTGILGGSGNTTHLAPGLFLAAFTVGSQTIAQLTALARAATASWWQVSVPQNGAGLSSPVSNADLVAAGGLT